MIEASDVLILYSYPHAAILLSEITIRCGIQKRSASATFAPKLISRSSIM